MSRLFLQSLSLSHFRSHRRSELVLDGRPIALFGPNGAGKTNILEAISLLSPGRGIRRASADMIARQPEGLGWKVSSLVSAGSEVREVETSSEQGGRRTVRIDAKLAPQNALGELCRMVWLIPSMDRLWLEGAEGRRRFWDRIALSFFPNHAEASLSYGKAMTERNRLLKDMVRDGRWYDALEARMAQSGAIIAANRLHSVKRLQMAMEHIHDAFPIADLEIEMEGPEEEIELREALADGRAADLRVGRSLLGPHRADLKAVYRQKSLDSGLCSTGEQKALLLSVILANARALYEDTGAPPVILLDEVAAHFDSMRRAALYDEICNLGAQAWMTGTEAELFGDLEERAQRFEVIELDGGSIVRNIDGS